MCHSTWISEILYKKTPDGQSFVAVFLHDAYSDVQESLDKHPVALLYGPQVPSWLPGLLAAGTGKRSPGLAYNRLLKGKFPYQRVEGQDKVRELKEMMS